MSNIYKNIFIQKRYAVLLLLGFASGLPLALTGGTLQAWMTEAGVDIKTIGFFSLVGQAYVFKFLWSPFMDRYTPPFLGRRRGWLLITQVLLIASIASLGFFNPQNHLWLIAALAVFVAFFSASQDIVFDAYKTDLLPPEERGTGSAISVLGYRLAMLVSGGIAMVLAHDYLGWQVTYWLMAAFMLVGLFATLKAPEPEEVIVAPKTLEKAVVLPLQDFFNRNNAWLILMLLILYKLGDAFAASLTTPFLMRGVGFDAGQVGMVNKTLGLVATIIGALFGGFLMQRLKLFKSLLFFGLLQAVSNFGYWILAVTDKNIFSMGTAVFLENLCGGMGTAAFVALLMTLCNKSFSATQFALLSALSAIGRVYVGPLAGWFVELQGWATFYLFSVIAALPGLLLLLICRKTLEYTQETDNFMTRSEFPSAYKVALGLLMAGCLLLILCLLLMITQYFGWLSWEQGENLFLHAGLILCFTGIVAGVLLDCLALRKTRLI